MRTAVLLAAPVLVLAVACGSRSEGVPPADYTRYGQAVLANSAVLAQLGRCTDEAVGDPAAAACYRRWADPADAAINRVLAAAAVVRDEATGSCRRAISKQYDAIVRIRSIQRRVFADGAALSPRFDADMEADVVATRALKDRTFERVCGPRR
jgi:hypothetical protein